MRASPAFVSRGLPGLVALALLGAGFGCTDVTGTEFPGVASVEITLPSTELRPGFWITASANVLDKNGEPLDYVVRWRSLTPQTLRVTDAEQGIVLGLAPGEGRLRASVGRVSSTVSLTLVNPPIARLVLAQDTLRLVLPGGDEQLTYTVRDSEDIAIIEPGLEWESSAPRIASVSVNGRVSAEAAGVARVIVHGGALADTVVVIVAPVPSPNAPVIGASAPTLAVPGQSIVVSGDRFSSSPSGNTVHIDGVPVAVTAASPQQLTLALPPASQFGCAPTGMATLQVRTSAGIGTGTVELQVATQRALSPGQSLIMSTGVDTRCIELAPATARYLVTVQNSGRSLGALAQGLTLGGALTLPVGLVAAGGAVTGGAVAVQPARSVRETPAARRLRAHSRVLNSVLQMPPPVPPTRPMPEARASLALPPAGSIHTIRVPNLESATDMCGSTYKEIGARAVAIGERVIILEDTVPSVNGKPTLQGTMDAQYAMLAAEFDAVVWPIALKFGNPLVMDGQLDRNQRVVIVFTPRMNQFFDGALLAATTTCDLSPRAVRPSSNFGEYIYAQVPTNPAATNEPGTRTQWLADIRATIAHETKHIVSYSERFARAWPLEHDWLEEAGGRVAEELFARAVYGTQQSANHDYTATLACEATLGAPSPRCPGQPRAMLPHFDALWDFLDAPNTRSPLGPVAAGDVSYYGSAWSLLRWMLDHAGTPEQALLQELTVNQATGVANLEARFGREWSELLAEWSMALATDDLPGVSAQSARLSFLSWNLPSIFAGLCADLGPCANPATTPSYYPRAQPLQPHRVSPGDFAVEFKSVAPGGFGAIEVIGTPTARQLLSLRGYRGAALPAEARLAIIRIE